MALQGCLLHFLFGRRGLHRASESHVCVPLVWLAAHISRFGHLFSWWPSWESAADHFKVNCCPQSAAWTALPHLGPQPVRAGGCRMPSEAQQVSRPGAGTSPVELSAVRVTVPRRAHRLRRRLHARQSQHGLRMLQLSSSCGGGAGGTDRPPEQAGPAAPHCPSVKN